MNSRRNLQNSVDLQPWSTLQTTDGNSYLIKSYFSDEPIGYDLILSDGVDLWRQKICLDVFHQKCKENNPNIEAKPLQFLYHVKDCLEECIRNSSATSENCLDETMNLYIRSKLQAGVPFNWTLSFEKCIYHGTNNDYSYHISKPLFVMVTELIRREKLLYSLLEQKDREIQDYKDQGITVSRRHLETLPFNKSVFQNTSNIEQDFLSVCQEERPDLHLSDHNDLYTNVMINRKCRKQTVQSPTKPSSSTFDTVSIDDKHPIGNVPVKPSWSGSDVIPKSIINDEPATLEPPISPGKSPKNIEKERREALRKRLEDEDERKRKKKKRKLNI